MQAVNLLRRNCRRSVPGLPPRPPPLAPTSGFPPFFFLLLCFFSGAGAAAGAAAAPPSPPAAAPPSLTVRPAMAPDTPASLDAFHRLYSSLSLGRKSLNSEGTPGAELDKGWHAVSNGDGTSRQHRGRRRRQRRLYAGRCAAGLRHVASICYRPAAIILKRGTAAKAPTAGRHRAVQQEASCDRAHGLMPARTCHGIILDHQGLHRGTALCCCRLGHTAAASA